MPPTDQQQPPSLLEGLKRQHNLLLWASGVLAFPVVAWTTRLGTWGSHYLGLTAALGLLWPPVFAAVYGPRPGVEAVWWFWLATAGVLVAHRVRGFFPDRRNRRCHSRFWGVSWFERADDPNPPRLPRHLTAALVLAAGVLVHQFLNPPLGLLLAIGAVAKFVSDAAAFRALDARVRQMADARVENEYALDQYRQRHGTE